MPEIKLLGLLVKEIILNYGFELSKIVLPIEKMALIMEVDMS